MDSTTVPRSSASCPPSSQAGDAAATLALVARLTEPLQRADAARALAQHLGVDALLIFTPDPELPVALPAPGFPQTLPQAPRWQAFVAASTADGPPHVGELPDLATGRLTQARGLGADDGAVLILLGGDGASRRRPAGAGACALAPSDGPVPP